MEIIPVIHVLNNNQVYKNVDTCLECGIKKIFLINHSDYNNSLVDLANEVKSKSGLWVGINLLGYDTTGLLFKDLKGVDGLWCDDGLSHMEESTLRTIVQKREYKGVFFGGLLFKYQAQPIDVMKACENSKIITDVSTTSGVATGKAPTRIKIENIRKVIGEHPLAIASGVSSENIKSFTDLVQYVLVASSITKSHDELIIKDKLMELIGSM